MGKASLCYMPVVPQVRGTELEYDGQDPLSKLRKVPELRRGDLQETLRVVRLLRILRATLERAE